MTLKSNMTHSIAFSLTGVKHDGVGCDGCNEAPLIGTRWKCADCFNYDLCSACFVNDVHDKQHAFLRFDQPGGNGWVHLPIYSPL